VGFPEIGSVWLGKRSEGSLQYRKVCRCQKFKNLEEGTFEEDVEADDTKRKGIGFPISKTNPADLKIAST